MSILKNKQEFSVLGSKVKVTDELLVVSLIDVRTISVPIAYFTRLLNATL